jgi:hypothetical protein
MRSSSVISSRETVSEPLQSVEHGLFVGHDSILRHPKAGCQRLQTKKKQRRPRRIQWKIDNPTICRRGNPVIIPAEHRLMNDE